jgi:2-desacetyl-2-hydroxyethyl bacteriochlorophyllide A dehydrogenase
MAKKIVFQGRGHVELIDFEPASVGEGQIRIRTTCSLISTGTEGICFMRLFEPGTHWDNWVKYPFSTGYCTVGVVTEADSSVSSVAVGDRVYVRCSHASEHVVDASRVSVIPGSVSDEQAMWAALAMIGSMILPTGDIRLEDDVAIIGAGPIGQMALRWCVAAGCNTIVCDPVAMRLEMASIGGATAVFAGSVDDFGSAIQRHFGSLPRIVIDTTGAAAVFAKALPLVRDFGTLVLLGDTGTPSEQRLTPDVIRRGVRIHAGHVMHETKDWHEHRIYHSFFRLLASGRFSLDGLNTHKFAPVECAEAYALTTEKRAETMGVWFDWSL